MKFSGSPNYVATADLMLAVNAAITLKRPLLIKGEPGTGKTLLAEEVAAATGLPLLLFPLHPVPRPGHHAAHRGGALSRSARRAAQRRAQNLLRVAPTVGAEEKAQHRGPGASAAVGGNKCIGTGGTNHFGHGGHNPQGIGGAGAQRLGHGHAASACPGRDRG